LANVINWSADPASTTITSFKIYRSICGTVSAAGPFTAQGKYLKILTDSFDFPRMIKISSDAIADIVTQLNLIPGVFCKVESATVFSIRASGKFLQIFDTDGATALGLTPGSYVPQKVWANVSTVPFVLGTGAYQFVDSSGYLNDWYYVTTVDPTSVESLPGVMLQHVENYLNVCCIEGFLVDFNGSKPIKGARVFASLFSGAPSQSVNSFAISKNIAESFTDEYGRWRLTVPRCATIYLEIEQTNYSVVFEVPNLSAYYFSQIIADEKWRFSNDSMPVSGGGLGVL
jgi:hypothetical protein